MWGGVACFMQHFIAFHHFDVLLKVVNLYNFSQERKFFEILEESAMKIRKNMQKHEDDIIRTRQQQERERQLRLQLLEKQRQKETYEKFKRITQEIEITHQEIFTKIQNFEYKDSPEYSHSRIPLLFENCAQIFSAAAAVLNKIKSPENLNEQQIPNAENNLQLIKLSQKTLNEEIQSVIKHIELRKIEEKKQQELVAKQQKEAAEAERQLSKPPPTPSTPKQTSQSEERYQKLKAKMAEYEEIDSKLKSSKSPELKKLVIHLSKAIGHPIASITGRSGSDVKRVARILTKIIKNNEVTVGNKTLSTKDNSFAIKFAENLMAKKLVLQAVQNSANFSSVFSIASVVISLWAECSDFGDLFLAHLQSKCMYTVPRYHTLTDTGGSNEDQWKAMGYEVSNGEIEEDDKFLQRMSGLIRLYAAVIQSPLPPGVSKHPYGLAKGWQWIAELLNMNPRPDITTTILHNFLEVAGHEMMNFYKKQFEKILFVICHDFYPKLEAATKDKASLARLKLFLEKCAKDKRFPIPEGRVDKNFWKTYHSGEVVGE